MAVIIKVRGGSVETVHSNSSDPVYLIDYDNHDNMDFKAKLEQLPTEPITEELARCIDLLNL